MLARADDTQDPPAPAAARQPWVGLGGARLGAVVCFALAFGLGSGLSSLLVLGPLATFTLPAVAMIAFWRNDWPGTRLTTPWSGLTDGPPRATPDEWITTAALSFIGAGIISHVGIGLRWPFAQRE